MFVASGKSFLFLILSFLRCVWTQLIDAEFNVMFIIFGFIGRKREAEVSFMFVELK